MDNIQLFYGGRWRDGDKSVELTDRFDFRNQGILMTASNRQVDEAMLGAASAKARKPLKPFERRRILDGVANYIELHVDKATEAVMVDAGFTRDDASTEVERTVETVRASADEAGRLAGEVVPLEGSPRGLDRRAFTVKSPVGVVCAITPFNSPLGTLMHKVAPAIAAGNIVVVKPSTYTPRTAAFCVDAFINSGLPETDIILLNGAGSTVGNALLDSAVPDYYAFTGSTRVGRQVRQKAGLRRTQLEMGSISSTIVCKDAELERVSKLVSSAAFRKAGQVCTSVQNLLVDASIFEELAFSLTERVSALKAGDYRDEEVDVGPVVSLDDATRIESLIQDAVKGGAELVTGGTRTGAVIEPTVLSKPAGDSLVVTSEIFGPVVSLRPFDTLGEAVDLVNASDYGLAAGIFTDSLRSATYAAEELVVGSVHINQTSSNRVDIMPYTGRKSSGSGTEGPKYAIQEMSHEKLITFGA